MSCLTAEFRCVFLDEEWKCRIYDERPEVCRMFGMVPVLDDTGLLLQCPFLHPSGSRRNHRERRLLRQFITRKFRDIDKRISVSDDGIQVEQMV